MASLTTVPNLETEYNTKLTVYSVTLFPPVETRQADGWYEFAGIKYCE